MLASLLLLHTDSGSDRLSMVRSTLSVALYPIHTIADLPASLKNTMLESASSYSALVTENRRLRKELLGNRGRLLKLDALEQENIHLRTLLEPSYSLGEQVLVADLLSVNLAPYKQVVITNKGGRFGIHIKQPVVDANGVVGQVTQVYPLYSEVTLITDPDHAIPVRINRNGIRTIAVGTGENNRLTLSNLPNNSDIQIGDLLITSGLGGTFPYGYPVAVVTEVIQQPDKPFALINAKPIASLDRGREVLMVWTNPKPIPLFPDKKKGEKETPSLTRNDNDG